MYVYCFGCFVSSGVAPSVFSQVLCDVSGIVADDLEQPGCVISFCVAFDSLNFSSDAMYAEALWTIVCFNYRATDVERMSAAAVAA